MISRLLTVTLPIIFGASVVAQSSSNASVVCVAGQCLQGFSNTTIGATLSAKDATTSVLLLPGSYSETTNPSLLHSLLTASSASLSPSTGFNASSVSLPLNVALQPGLAIYAGANYSGKGSFAGLPSTPLGNSSDTTPISGDSLSIASDIWVAVTSGSSKTRFILWDSVPDIAQLPSGASGSLGLLDLQSSACSPPCSGNGVCSAAGTCTCPTGFTGASCESCADGFFGPNCDACPAGCAECDGGISGTGRCLSVTVENPPSKCNCLNGQCQPDGSCACNVGWTAATNGTACAKCAAGFFLNPDGDCNVCQLGCTSCADSTGTCITCADGFTQDANDGTKCVANASKKSDGTVCPDGSFGDGTTCQACAATCKTCSGSTSNDCVICGNGNYKLNGSCVSTDGNGVCEGTTGMIADNNKHECDSCPAKCTSCGIPNFNVASTIDEVQCTGCLPGFVLSQGKCVESCPTGNFLSPQDNLTCTACDSSCSTCAGSSTFCLTCANNQLASSGSCVASCPSNTFSSSGKCITCHPDCATCSGAGFNQCSSCPPDRPVLTNGRCLPTCSKNQFFDTTSSTCQSCDATCSSCSGSGPSNCLACASTSQVLRGGTCGSASCTSNTTVVPGLGVCLSDLVLVPAAASGTSAAPLPTITGINTPIAPSTSTSRRLEWWEILLMALGCAFIFLVVLMLWRRRARAKRANKTAAFATTRGIRPPSWRRRLLWRLFGRRPQPVLLVDGPEPAGDQGSEAIRLMKIRNAEEARHHHEMEKLAVYGAYEYSAAGSTRAPSALLSLHDDRRHWRESSWSGSGQGLNASRLSSSDGSMYSQITGMPRKGPDPRQPVKEARLALPTSRFSVSTDGRSKRDVPTAPLVDVELEDARSEAEHYARSVRGQKELVPTSTGGSSNFASRNPFRR